MQLKVLISKMNSESGSKAGFLHNQSGQALLEYILIMVVTVAIILGLMTQFYKPFGRYVENFMGEYLQCLLETGELPGTANSECQKSFEAGNPFKGTNGGGQKLAKNDTSQSQGNASSGNRHASSNAGRGSSDGSRRGGLDRFGNGSSEKPKEEAKSAPTYAVNGSSEFANRRMNYQFNQNKAKKIMSVGVVGMSEAERDKLKKEHGKIRSQALESGSETRKKKKFLVNRPNRQIAEADSEAGFSFGQLFRLLLIILILLAIIVFFGSQALQISKSWEK